MFSNTNIKNNLYNSLPLSYHVLDDTVLADGREKINIVDYKSDSKNDLYCLDLFDIYIDAINKIKTLGNNTSYYNYTLCVYDELFGFDSMDFF